jgi:two-component system phosphate regulon sensor histidine kinase PhoR
LHSFSSRFLVVLIAIIVITTLAAGVPAYILIRSELDKQAWARISDGGRVTMALLEAEKMRLENLAVLLAQRPTLQELARGSDMDALNQYLRTFQATIDLDILVLSDQSGRIIARGTDSLPSVEPQLLQGTFFQVLDGAKPQLVLSASKPLPVDGDQALYVVVGILLDDDYVKNLSSETGFEHGFLVGEQRVSTTLENAILEVTAIDAIKRATDSGKMETTSLDCQNSHCYVALSPLFGFRNEVVGLSEVILPVNDLLAAKQNALRVLVFSTLLVAIVTSALASYFAQRLTSPLKNLTEAAIKISQGDLNSPIPVPDSPSEITTLAMAFEKSRETTLLALEDLSRSKIWFETLIQSVAEGIVTIDGQGKVTSFNQGAERITGWKSNEALGISINQIFPIVEGDGDFVQHIVSAERAQQVNVKTRDGREVTLAVTGAPLHSVDGCANQTALVLRDISEEETVRRLRSYFLANISHEFRTPLTALNASVELLLGDIEELSLAEIAELLKSIHLSVTGLQTLIDNLLESTSIESGRFHIRCRPTDVGDVVSNALQVMAPLMERRRQRLSLAIPAQLPLVNADPTRLSQALVNLLSNASKYSPMESIIELSLQKTDDRTLRISVSDQGPGIPLPERSKLYQRFMRFEESESAQYGVGLGLSVVKAIVEAHHGKVGMEERLGGGSIFWFTIPIQEEI